MACYSSPIVGQRARSDTPAPRDAGPPPDESRAVPVPRPYDFDASAFTPAPGPLATLGDADAVPRGDLHLPSLVARALVGEPRADDARMLALLEPHRGHRFRLIRLLLASGRIRPGRGARE